MKAGGIQGVVFAIVADRDDPAGQGRIRVTYPWLSDNTMSPWAPIASLSAGNDRGLYFMPEIGDEALVAFVHNDFDHPVVLGFMWNGVDRTPSSDVRQRMIRTTSGHTIRMADGPSPMESALVVEDATGNRITLSNGKVTISSVALLELEAPVIVFKGPGYNRVLVPSSNPV